LCNFAADESKLGVRAFQLAGRVAIWTRDMSWAQNADTRRLLRDKAVRGELILCLPEENELARELAVAVAEVCAYGANHLDAPASRFTTAWVPFPAFSVMLHKFPWL
jgi:hypothetical protein